MEPGHDGRRDFRSGGAERASRRLLHRGRGATPGRADVLGDSGPEARDPRSYGRIGVAPRSGSRAQAGGGGGRLGAPDEREAHAALPLREGGVRQRAGVRRRQGLSQMRSERSNGCTAVEEAGPASRALLPSLRCEGRAARSWLGAGSCTSFVSSGKREENATWPKALLETDLPSDPGLLAPSPKAWARSSPSGPPRRP